MVNPTDFSSDVSNFINNYRKLCILSLGFAILAYSVVNIGKRAYAWIVKPTGTAATVNTVSTNLLQNVQNTPNTPRIDITIEPTPLKQTEISNDIVYNNSPEAEIKEKEEKEVEDRLLAPPIRPKKQGYWAQMKANTYVRLEVGTAYTNTKFKIFIDSIGDGDFFKIVSEAAKSKYRVIDRWTVNNLTYPHIYMPKPTALKHLAIKYFEKYNVQIRITSTYDLCDLITAIDREVDSSQFVGIFVATSEISHAIPIILFFGKKDRKSGGRIKQILIADTLGRGHSLFKDVHTRLQEISRSEKIFTTTKIRQVDQYSCRTGVMQLLKRGLLALQNSPDTQDLASYLMKHATMTSDQTQENLITIEDLPPEFDASEQITNKIESRHTVKDIRDKFSKNPAKRVSPRTVSELRLAHQEEVTFTCEFMLDIPEGIALPDNVTVRGGNFVTITAKRKVNTHLVKKAKALGENHVPKFPYYDF